MLVGLVLPDRLLAMNVRKQYSEFLYAGNVQGSNKASSYIRALVLLDGILRQTGLLEHRDFWSIESVDEIDRLYKYALEFQKEEGSIFLHSGLPPSYGRNGYYSAALKSYQQFLVLRQYEDGLWDVYNTSGIDPTELGKKLARKKIKFAETLVEDRDVDFSTKEGKDILRQTKARVNQKFFRDMILVDYETQCCVTGLNIPAVLRASHIVGWAEDKANRMNPANGLCLSATYDAAFDRHLISFDDDFRMILSPGLKEHYSNEAFKTHFLAFEGKLISPPKRFCPDQSFLEKHRQKLVA
ncbi:HNH endonuclease [Tichowtungia aerotolerans]|uniref:HNH endonuclease n=1 Tax=Tichowtungia aerotolerans TaxID=2697043 RepID=UPI001E4C7457|nr:HNH endonuclease [Tichowtungia aerotolerans]